MVCIVVATKYFFEQGSEESRRPPLIAQRSGRGLSRRPFPDARAALTGLGWLWLYARMDPDGKWGQVVGNILSEWVQMIGLVLLTKGLFEEHSRESHGVR